MSPPASDPCLWLPRPSQHHGTSWRPRSAATATLALCCAALAALVERTGAGRKLSSWRGPDSLVLGTPPAARAEHGLALVRGRLYVFGGTGAACGADCVGESRGKAGTGSRLAAGSQKLWT